MRSRLNRRLLATAVFVGTTGLVLAGCSGGGGGTGNGPGDFGDSAGKMLGCRLGRCALGESHALFRLFADGDEARPD